MAIISLFHGRLPMRTLLRSGSLALALAIWAITALAQQVFIAPFGGGDSTMLLQEESVQKELKLTAEQINKVEKLSEKMRDKFHRVIIQGSEEERDKQRKELR